MKAPKIVRLMIRINRPLPKNQNVINVVPKFVLPCCVLRCIHKLPIIEKHKTVLVNAMVAFKARHTVGELHTEILRYLFCSVVFSG